MSDHPDKHDLAAQTTARHAAATVRILAQERAAARRLSPPADLFHVLTSEHARVMRAEASL